MSRKPATRVLLSPRIQKPLLEQFSEQGEGEVFDVWLADELNLFFKEKLKDVSERLFLTLRKESGSKAINATVVARAFKPRKDNEGCTLAVANLICVYIANEDVTLRQFAKRYGLTIADFRKIQQGAYFENLDVFEESELTDDEKLKLKKKGAEASVDWGAHTKALITNLQGIYLDNGLFSTIRIPGNESMEELSMRDYYIQLSSIDAKTGLSPEQLLVLEKQSAEYKSVYWKTGIEFRSADATRTISADLWEKDNYAYVIGNPGVGKSTYARWLCHLWAKKVIGQKVILVYINLRDVNFVSQNSLIEYTGKVYYKQGVDTINLSDLFAQLGTQIVFLLDGLDELNYGYKQKLYDDLIATSASKALPKYVVFTRPYGLLETKFRLGNVNVEIIGFNNAQRFQYLTSLFARNHNAKSPERLLQIIDNNVVLKSLSFNPLMLSYLSLIYFHLNDETEFAAINSTYSITEKLVEIVITHHQLEKNIAQSDYVAQLQQCLGFCGNMELNKQFVYTTNGPIDKNLPIITLLSQLGLGHISNGQLGKKIFHLHTVTVQEYLASTYWSNYITQEAFIYLIGDPVFWNLSKMILGNLSHNGNESLVNEILISIHEKCNREIRLEASVRHFIRLRTNIIGELTSDTLNAFITEAEVYDILTQYWEVCYDPIWCPLFEETVARIFHKVEPRIQKYFIEYIISELNDLIDFEAKSPNYSPPNQRILIEILGITENYQLANYLIEKIAETIDRRNNDPDEINISAEGSFYRFWTTYLLEILNTQNIKNLPSLLIKCKALLDSVKVVDAQTLAIMLSLQMYQETKEVTLAFRNDLTNTIAARQNGYANKDLFNIVREYCLMLTLLRNSLPSNVEEIDGWLSEVKELINGPLKEVFGTKEMKELNSIILPLLLANAKLEAVKLVFATQARYGIKLIYSKYITSALDEYLKTQVFKLTRKFEVEGAQALLYAFKSTLHTKYALSEYLQALPPLVAKLYTNIANDESEKAVVIKLVDETFYFPTDRKALVDHILEHERSFLFLPLLNVLMAKFLPLSEKLYWDFLINLSQRSDSDALVVNVLHNKDIYRYPQNLDRLQLWWKEVVTLVMADETRAIWLKNTPHLLSIAYLSVTLLQETYREKQNHELLAHIKEIITDTGFKEVSLTIKPFQLRVKNLVVYTILHTMYGDPDLVLGDEYLLKLNNDFYDELIEKKVPKIDCEKALGNEVYVKLEERRSIRAIYKYEVEKATFVGLLKGY